MPAINHTAFPDKVARGDKCCTIRAMRKRPFVKGDTLYHYTGMRTRNCTKLMTVPCLNAQTIEIRRRSGIWLNGKELSEHKDLLLAIMDGFQSAADLRNYFLSDENDVFVGQLIQWCPRDATYWPAGGVL